MSERWTEWDAAAAARVFAVSLAPDGDAVVLGELATELREEGAPERLSLALGDRILIARLSLPMRGETSYDYLVHAWTRCRTEEARVRHTIPEEAERALQALQGARALLISYAGLVLQMPDMFPSMEKAGRMLSPRALVPTLLQLGTTDMMQDDGSAVWATPPLADTPQFVREFVARFAQDDALGDTVGVALHALTQRVRTGSTDDDAPPPSANAEPAADDVQRVLAQMLGLPDPRGASARKEGEGMTIAGLEWRPVQQAVATALELKPLAQAVPYMATFAPRTTAPLLERESLLGPLLRLSCFADAYPSIARTHFTEAKTRSPIELENHMSSLRMALEVVQTNNFGIFNALVRAGTDARERVLAFLGEVCALNAKRGAMQARASEIASDAFMVNVYDVVLRFAMPFADVTCAKIDRVDARFLQQQRRWDTRSLTRIHASEAEAGAWLDAAEASAPPFHFITEIFFLGTRLSNLALGKAIRRVDEREKEIDRLQKRADELEAERGNWQGLPQGAHVEQVIQRAKAQVDRLHSEVIAAQTQLLAPAFVTRVIQFLAFTMNWIVRLADPQHTHPQTLVALPLPQEVDETFRMLPEHMFEDVCDTILFYARHKPDVLDESARDSVVVFCTTFLSSGWWIRNPFLKAKLAEMLSYNLMPFGPYPSGVLGGTINSHPLALQHLVPALIAFWIDAESTGSHTQFYDKFNIRYHLVQIFKEIWGNPDHKQRLFEQATRHPGEFTVFINRLMNDVTFLLDDALDKLAELHNKQLQVDDRAAWEERTPDERREHEAFMHSIEGQIRSDLSLGHEFLRLLIKFSAETSAAFMTPEIVDRLAAMLDYNLDVLVGARCQELKVKDPKKVGFDPRSLLSEILSVFLNLSPHDEFAAAIARDGRSYSRETFSKAASIAQRHMLKSPPDIDKLARLVNRVEQIKQETADEEEDLGDVPDEYLDPLLATLMRDPVRLPSSRAVVDRSTIKAHLLSDSKDPFNRMPLKLEDVQPDDALRAEIEAFLQQRKAASTRP
ncbi:RING-type E3 ubiquitin transferase [Malassezia brasiliensis]|uniref:RING-type E3 ubiquitin transferase n=1 Tax=Malassezia brasiliensis TaxID=1821822 RepID=A0AAF0ISM9_9BASI|nr:RING-type E3 ubiquitin transferase [Malassezia brasiliensis]